MAGSLAWQMVPSCSQVPGLQLACGGGMSKGSGTRKGEELG